MLKRATEFARRLIPWILPYALYGRMQRRPPADEEARCAPHRMLIRENAEIRDRHKGERCFILCNGPSVMQQNLSLLVGETVISVSSGYHHPQYGQFRPRYHCVPQLSSDHLSDSGAAAWFDEMHSALGEAEIFLSTTDASVVRRYDAFSGRKIRYVFFNGSFANLRDREIVDLSQDIPGVQTASVMCLMMAMYFGFKDIYFLGADHDHFKTGKYTYFFEPTVLKGIGPGVTVDGKIFTSRHDDFIALSLLWQQYRKLREIATANGVSIFNATAGGELDEFPRVQFESLFDSRPGIT